MKKILFKRVFGAAVAGCLLAASLTVPSGASSATKPVVSYGVSVFAAKTDMAVMTLVGNEIAFSKDVFARALNLSEIKYITVSTLPSVADGELLLGSTRVAAGQSISAENLSYMTFAAGDPDTPLHSSFTFTANGGTTPIVCNLYLLSRGNYTPTVSVASALSLCTSTYRDLCAYGTLAAYDPDGDALCFEVVSYPQNGALRMVDRSLGNYVYTPNAGYVGTDRFTYVARDKYGNYSTPATVELRVSHLGTSVTYEDMKDSREYNAALKLTEAGIMSGTQVGSLYYFYPEREVSRVEFLVMAMNAVGITDVPACERTDFADDALIPTSMKGYVQAAHELGYIDAQEVDGALCFAPNETLTRAQAAVILSDLVGLHSVAVTPTFADLEEIPTWASEAIYSLSSAGILSTMDGYILPGASLTRAETAQMLAAAMQYTEKK